MVSGLLARCIIITIGTLYPAYRSYKSLVNSDLREVVTWLRYWTVFAIFSAGETVTDLILSWFPFYYWIKIIIIFCMVSPTGSTLLYKRFIQPVLNDRQDEIDRFLEELRRKGYSAMLDLTSAGVQYASNAFLNTAVLGQSYLGEHLKKSYSANDIDAKSSKTSSNPPPATLYEDDEIPIAKRNGRKPLSPHQDKPEGHPSRDYEVSKVLPRKPQNANNGNISKQKTKAAKLDEHEADDEVENRRNF